MRRFIAIRMLKGHRHCGNGTGKSLRGTPSPCKKL